MSWELANFAITGDEAAYALIGFFVVLAFSLNYFNEPKYPFADGDGGVNEETESLLEPALPKYMTNRYQYNLYLLAFILVTEMVYAVLSFVMPVLASDGDLREMSTRSGTLAAALIITGILPNMPYVRGFLNRVKGFFHEKAQIPNKGREVYYILRRPRIMYQSDVISEVLTDDRYSHHDSHGAAQRGDLDEGDFETDPASIEGKWAKLTYLLYHVYAWSKSAPFKNCLFNRELRWGAINHSYDDIRSQIVDYRNGRLSNEATIPLYNNLESLLNRTYRLISCLLFMCDRSACRVYEKLEELGYETCQNRIFAIPVRQFVIAAFAAGMAIILGATVSGVLSWILGSSLPVFKNAQITTNNIMKWLGYGVPFLMLPVLFVLLLKRHFSFREDLWPVVRAKNPYRTVADRPWHVYSLVTVLAYFIGALTLIMLKTTVITVVTGGLPSSASLQVYGIFVWSLVPMVTAAFIAYRIDSVDNGHWSGLRRYVPLFGGAVFQGAVTAGAICFAFVHLEMDGVFNVNAILESPLAGKFVTYIMMGFVIGCALFFSAHFVPRQPEARCAERYHVDVPVLLRMKDKTLPASLISISERGVLMAAPELDTRPGTGVEIELNNKVSFKGTVVSLENGLARFRVNFGDSWNAIKAQLPVLTPSS